MSPLPPTALRPWRVEGSRHPLRDRWISVRADACVTQRGARLDAFYVLEYPDWAHCVAFDDADNIVLVRQYRHGLQAVTLELPGGMMDPHDADPLVAAARELREETGCVAADLRVFATLSPNPATHANRIHGVLATGVREVGGLSLDASEDVEVVRRPWREAVAGALAGEMQNSQHVALLLTGVAQTKGLSFG